ncbi:MAG: aminomethyl-transferring glycine dehydrogenase subunit GcvPB, partial [Candidatus Thermoplasmatota archaeon]
NEAPEKLRRKKICLPLLTEQEVFRHYLRLSQMSFGVDSGFYPLGSCTMKYTPKICEELGWSEKAMNIHPYQNEKTIQGALKIMYELSKFLCNIGGVDEVSLQPSAGAQGELTGMLIAKAYHEDKNENRNEVIIPDTAHGTNPASASMAGYEVVELQSKDGCIDIDALERTISDKTAAFMLTNPNTLGIFESEVKEVARILHDKGALLYYDGANLNAILGRCRPGDMGADIVHFNLHKTFASPHGGGGPGSGPIGVKSKLKNFLPVPIVDFDGKKYFLDYGLPKSIGKIKNFYGNFFVLLRAYVYIKLLGGNGLKEASELAVLKSNYLKKLLESEYNLPYKSMRKHEFVLSGKKQKEKGMRTLDISKALLDYGIHSPTIYFPTLVEEALMIEPTETESKFELDNFVAAMIKISREGVKDAPKNTSVSRVDEAYAARNPILSWRMYLATTCNKK